MARDGDFDGDDENDPKKTMGSGDVKLAQREGMGLIKSSPRVRYCHLLSALT